MAVRINFLRENKTLLDNWELELKPVRPAPKPVASQVGEPADAARDLAVEDLAAALRELRAGIERIEARIDTVERAIGLSSAVASDPPAPAIPRPERPPRSNRPDDPFEMKRIARRMRAAVGHADSSELTNASAEGEAASSTSADEVLGAIPDLESGE